MIDAGPRADAGASGPVDAGAAPHVNLAEQVWAAQEGVWRTGIELRSGACQAAISWLVAIKRATGMVQNGTYTEFASGSPVFTPGGNTIKVRNAAGWSGQLRVDGLVGDVTVSGFPHGSDFIDVSWLWSDSTTGRCSLREMSDRISGRFWVGEERVDVDFTSASDSQVDSSYDPQTYSSVVFALGHRVVTGSLSTLTGNRTVSVRTESDWSSCSGSPCYSDALWYQHQHAVQLRLDGVTWSLAYETGFVKETPAAMQAQLWRGSIAGPTPGVLVVRPFSNFFTLDVVIGSDRYTVDSATRVQ